jgi:peptidoglycan hydrolase CwlO-like protein
MRISFKKIAIIFLIGLFGFFNFLNFQVKAADDAGTIQDKLDSYQNKAEDVTKDLQQSQGLLQKTTTQVITTQSLITKTVSEIARQEAEVKNLNDRIELNRKILSEYVRQVYYTDQESLVMELVFKNNNLSGILGNLSQSLGVKDRILNLLEEIKKSKEELGKTQVELEGKKDDHEKLLNIQKSEQVEIKQDVQEAQATLAELNAKINKLKGELSQLLGSAVSFKNVVDAAAFAAKATGVRKDYLLGVLVVESNLGRYTGGCTFKQSRMSGTRATIFKSICKELDYNYEKQKVSCPPSGYKGTGGAMGVAQFMPDTWSGYKSSIAGVTGHNPPDPWSLTDGVTAMALKLAKVSGVTEHKKSAEAKAYCIYLAGGNWAAYCDSKGVDYGAKVLYWADNYEQKLN